MDVSGTSHEGWMMFVPLTVLVLIVVYVLGGPAAFMNTVSNWAIGRREHDRPLAEAAVNVTGEKGMMTSVLTLSDLLTRTVIVEAHEAVAIVLDVADRILARDAGAYAVPDLREVQVSSDGRVAITGTLNVGEPVRRLGQLLQALLAQSSPPVQLRLVISQATAPEPAYESIRDYTDALAYFATAGSRSLHPWAVRARAREFRARAIRSCADARRHRSAAACGWLSAG